MDAVDASGHYEIYDTEEVPSLCAVIVDTNPRAWAALARELPISTAIANILVFVNAHLALNNANQVAILAAHCNRAVWLYPRPPESADEAQQSSEDVDMPDADADANSAGAKPTEHKKKNKKDKDAGPNGHAHSANKYPQFAQIDASVLASLRSLISSTSEEDLAQTTTQISGALTLALAYINKTSLSTAAAQKLESASTAAAAPGATTQTAAGGAAPAALSGSGSGGGLTGLHARILVVSVSDSAAAQYIPTMNAVFAAAHARVGIDVLALGPSSAAFLQQASFVTRGTFLRAAAPRGLLSYLMFGFASATNAPASGGSDGKTALTATAGGGGTVQKKSESDKDGTLAPGSELLMRASADAVDFRAACFCHRRVVDQAFVCSICLSIFCEVPPGAECLTCGTRLALGNYGAKPAVVARLPRSGGASGPRRKKRRIGINGEGREDTGSAAGTPTPVR